MPNRRLVVYFLGVLSGLLAGVVFFIDPYFGPGIVFGLLVVFPWARWDGLPTWRLVSSVLFSPIAYYLAVWLFLEFDAHGPLCGGVGALITFGPLFLRWSRRSLQVLLTAVLAGATAGGIGTVLIRHLPNDNFYWPLKMVSALILWQASTASVLALALRPARSEPKMSLPRTPLRGAAEPWSLAAEDE
jgi:hypothetical protein